MAHTAQPTEWQSSRFLSEARCELLGQTGPILRNGGLDLTGSGCFLSHHSRGVTVKQEIQPPWAVTAHFTCLRGPSLAAHWFF